MQKIALYRKYRPDNFDELVGQDHIIRVLENAVLGNKISHAYLFSGPRGTGKTSVARILAKAINCTERKGHNPCGKCNICKGIQEGRVMDLIEIDAASNRGIDEIRDLREKVKFSPTEGSYKVFIIDEVHMLTKEAFNALLKTLEEPPEHAVFILATTEINKVPQTIISRCQRHDFKRIKLSDIVAQLSKIKKKENIDITDEALEIIAEASEGGLRDAISLLDQLSSVGLKNIAGKDVENILGIAPHTQVSDFINALSQKDQKKAVNILDSITSSGVDLVIFTRSALDLTRKLLAIKLGADQSITGTKEQIEELKSLAGDLELESIVEISDQLVWAQSIFRTSINPKIILTLICAKLGTERRKVSTDKAEEPKKVQGEAPAKPAAKRKPNGEWQHFLMEIKAKNNTLHACLRVGVPEFTENGLTIIFPYQFHKERVEESKNKRLVEDLLEKVYNERFEVTCVLESNGQRNRQVEDADSAASILGGKIVD